MVCFVADASGLLSPGKFPEAVFQGGGIQSVFLNERTLALPFRVCAEHLHLRFTALTLQTIATRCHQGQGARRWCSPGIKLPSEAEPRHSCGDRWRRAYCQLNTGSKRGLVA